MALTVAFGVCYADQFLQRFATWWDALPWAQAGVVVLLAAFLLWHRREHVLPWPQDGSWWSAPFMVLWALHRLSSAWFDTPYFDEFSLPLCLTWIALLVGGWRAMAWVWPAVLLSLGLNSFHAWHATGLLDPLNQAGIAVGVFVMQTCGVFATSQGTVLLFPGGDGLEVPVWQALWQVTCVLPICWGVAMAFARTPQERIVLSVGALPLPVLAHAARVIWSAWAVGLPTPLMFSWPVQSFAYWAVVAGEVGLLWAGLLLLRRIVEQ